jgi:UDP-glucose 4-epimerase
MSSILIIGASGYVGGRLSYLLANVGHEVTALCFPQIPADNAWCSVMKETILEDITKKESIEKITNQPFDIAIHLVSLDHHDSTKDPNFVNSINVMPVWNLLEAFKIKKTLKRFIYFSTVQVYGVLSNQVVNESYAPKPLNPYGLTHLLAENIGNMFHASTQLECVNLRLSNSYGSPYFKKNNCWWLVVNDLCKTAFTKNRIVLKSDGSAIRDFIHYKDIFQTISSLIESELPLNINTFNLSGGISYTIYELALEVKKVYQKRYGKKIEVIRPSIKQSANLLNNKYIIDNQRIRNMGFEQIIDLTSGINELFDYLELNGK